MALLEASDSEVECAREPVAACPVSSSRREERGERVPEKEIPHERPANRV
jgi:hypothetical protein